MGVGGKIKPIIAVKDSVVGAVGSRVSHSSEHRSRNPCCSHDSDIRELEMKLPVDN